jgi:hypothetical protein
MAIIRVASAVGLCIGVALLAAQLAVADEAVSLNGRSNYNFDAPPGDRAL